MWRPERVFFGVQSLLDLVGVLAFGEELDHDRGVDHGHQSPRIS
jgi:hypothetical protein